MDGFGQARLCPQAPREDRSNSAGFRAVFHAAARAIVGKNRKALPGSCRMPVLFRLACVAALLAVTLAHAQSTPPPDTAELARRLEQSLQRIDALSRRVEQLERQLATQQQAAAPTAPASQPAATPDTNARLARVEQTVSELAATEARLPSDNAGIALHGFADTQAVATRRPRAGQPRSFAIGTLDFYLTPELGEHVKTLVELNFGADSEGETEADIERLQIGYAFSDALTVWLGRFHTPFGYWNLAYHHGAQIQTTIARPRMLDFEDDGGFLPVHTTGVWATGAQRLGGGRLQYHLWSGNGTRIEGGQLNPNAGGDDNGNLVAGAAASYRFGGTLGGLSLGVNGLTQKVDVHDGSGSRVRLRLGGAHAVYDDDGWEAIAEGYVFRNSDLAGAGGTQRSWSGYAQVGRSIGERWLPYVRLEKASLSAFDPYFVALDSGRFDSRQVIGVRYNADPRAALKLEWARTRERGLSLLDTLRLQYAIGF
jgi:hypothetical protein